MLFWNAIYKIIPLYNTIWIMVLAYVVLYLPYTVQYVTSAFIGICPALRWTRKKYETGYLHWLHKAISNLKAFLLGTYHGRCTQLQVYLDEFCFVSIAEKPAIKSSCAWQEPSLHLVPSCVKPISKFDISRIFLIVLSDELRYNDIAI